METRLQGQRRHCACRLTRSPPVGRMAHKPPAQEPIVVARKPLEGNVARNVLKYGTGALNIGACRVEGKINHSHTTMSDIRGSQSNGGQYILKTHERERLPR